MPELQEVIDSVMALPLDEKAYLAEVLLKDINTRKTKLKGISQERTFGEYIGKIEMSDDFDAPLPDEFWLGNPNEDVT